MFAPRERLDIDALVRNPADCFATPMDVVNDARLNKEEKKRALDSWARDAEQLSQAEADNMSGPDRPRLQEVHLALLELQKRK